MEEECKHHNKRKIYIQGIGERVVWLVCNKCNVWLGAFGYDDKLRLLRK